MALSVATPLFCEEQRGRFHSTVRAVRSALEKGAQPGVLRPVRTLSGALARCIFRLRPRACGSSHGRGPDAQR